MNENNDMPKQWTLENFSDYMHMQKTWYNTLNLIVMSLFFAVWVGATIYIFSLIIQNSGRSSGNLGILVSVIFGLGAVGFGYTIVANYYNKTDVFVSQNLMEIKIGPIAWPGNQRVETKNIIQFYTKKVVSGTGNNRTVTYQIWYRCKDGTKRKILSGFSDLLNAEFIEHKLEDYLGIKDLKGS